MVSVRLYGLHRIDVWLHSRIVTRFIVTQAMVIPYVGNLLFEEHFMKRFGALSNAQDGWSKFGANGRPSGLLPAASGFSTCASSGASLVPSAAPVDATHRNLSYLAHQHLENESADYTDGHFRYSRT